MKHVCLKQSRVYSFLIIIILALSLMLFFIPLALASTGTLGYTSVGGTGVYQAGVYVCDQFTLSQQSWVTALHIYLGSSTGNHLNFVIYNETNGALLYTSGNVASAANQWVSLSHLAIDLLAGTYDLGIQCAGGQNMVYDANVGYKCYYYGGATAPSNLSGFSGSDSTRELSIYADWTTTTPPMPSNIYTLSISGSNYIAQNPQGQTVYTDTNLSNVWDECLNDIQTAGSGTINFAAGNYTANFGTQSPLSGYVILPCTSNMLINGAGALNTFIVAAANLPEIGAAPLNANGIWLLGSPSGIMTQNVTVQNICFDGNLPNEANYTPLNVQPFNIANTYGGNYTFQNDNFYQWSSGIEIIWSNGTIVQNNLFDYSSSNVWIDEGSSNCAIKNNIILNTIDTNQTVPAVSVVEFQWDIYNNNPNSGVSGGNIISGNTISGTLNWNGTKYSVGSQNLTAIYIYETTGLTVQNNIIIGFNDGIQLGGYESLGNVNLLFSNNTIENELNLGVEIANARYVGAENNFVTGCTNYGIYMDGTETNNATNNIITSCAYGLLYGPAGGNDTVNYNDFANNTTPVATGNPITQYGGTYANNIGVDLTNSVIASSTSNGGNVVSETWAPTYGNAVVGLILISGPVPTPVPSSTGIVPFLSFVVGAAFSSFLLFAMVPFISVAALIVGVVISIRSGKEVDSKTILIAVILVVAINVMVFLGILIVNGIQNALMILHSLT